MKEKIHFDEFLAMEAKLEIQMGQIAEAERVPNSKKLLKLMVIFGPNKEDIKTVVTNLGDKFEPEYFIGLWSPFITNLAYVKMMGVESQAMILVGTKEDGSLKMYKDWSEYGVKVM
jgi:methionyl-tRNA synthetase